MILQRKIFLLALVSAALAFGGCIKNKENDIVKPPAMAEFPTTSNVIPGAYFIKNDPNSVFKIPVGLSAFASTDKNITFTVTSSTGAAAGTQYNIVSPTVTIPAGKLIDSIAVKGLFAGYPTGRKDTLTFTITGGDAPVFPGNNVYKLLTQKYCDVISADLTGAYANTRDYYAGSGSAASYTATIANWTSTGATTASIKILNFGATTDVGFGPFAPTDPATTGINATLNWANPASFTITIPSQPYVASLYTYGPSTISGSGSFSSCDKSFTIAYTVNVSAGNFTGTSTIMKK